MFQFFVKWLKSGQEYQSTPFYYASSAEYYAKLMKSIYGNSRIEKK